MGNENYIPYVEALKLELATLAATQKNRRLKSLFIGGGTPSVLPCSLATGLINCCLQFFPPTRGAEITLEANPGTVDEKYFQGLLQVGVNRISLGIQSFDDRELSILGRLHNRSKAIDAVKAAKNAGFTNINLDMMYGLPGQKFETWRTSLQEAISLDTQHLSLYQLTIEEGTPFHKGFVDGNILLPPEEEILIMDDITERLCSSADLQRYEISAFAKSGYECLHNITYWQNDDYLACGASAVSCVGGVRERRIDEPLEYVRRIRRGQTVVVESECLSLEASFRESVIMGLRLSQGASLQRLKDRYSLDLVNYYGEVLENLIKLKLVILTNTHLCLSAKGRQVANWVMAELV